MISLRILGKAAGRRKPPCCIKKTGQQKEVYVSQLEGERSAREQTRKKTLLHSLTASVSSLQIVDDVVLSTPKFQVCFGRYRINKNFTIISPHVYIHVTTLLS